MNRYFRNIALLLALAIPAQGQEEKKEDEKPPAPPLPTRPAPPKPAPRTQTITGQLTSLVEGGQSFRLKVEVKEINEGAANNLLRAQARLREVTARRPTSPEGLRSYQQNIVKAQLDIAKAQADLYRLKLVDHPATFSAAEDMQVRLPEPKAAFDEMGNIKRYTSRELAALRGRDRMYDGEVSDLINGQVVQVTVIVPTTARPQNKDDIPLAEPSLQVTRIAVLRQPVPK